MKLEGSFTLSASRDTVWQKLMDAQVLARVLPGNEGLETGPEGGYQVALKVGIGAVKGTYSGRIEILDPVPPERYRLKIEGRGARSFLKGEGDLALAEQGSSSTLIHYVGEIQLGGLLASVGQRLLEGAARQMISRFFEALAHEIHSTAGPTAVPAPPDSNAAPESPPPPSTASS
jgi:uncharacterized protein